MFTYQYEISEYLKAHQARFLREAAQARQIEAAQQARTMTTKPRRLFGQKLGRVNIFAR